MFFCKLLLNNLQIEQFDQITMTICDSILDRMAISMTLFKGFHTDAAHNCLVMVVVGKAIGLNAVDSTHGRTYLRTRFLEPPF